MSERCETINDHLTSALLEFEGQVSRTAEYGRVRMILYPATPLGGVEVRGVRLCLCIRVPPLRIDCGFLGVRRDEVIEAAVVRTDKSPIPRRGITAGEIAPDPLCFTSRLRVDLTPFLLPRRIIIEAVIGTGAFVGVVSLRIFWEATMK